MTGERRPEHEWPTYRLYGVAVRSDFEFRNRLVPADGRPDVTFRCSVSPDDSDRPAGERLWPPAPEASPVSLHAGDGHPVIRFGDVSAFTLFDDRIECRLFRPAEAHLIEIQFLGVVLALWLERRGTPVLHASAVDVGGQAVAFLGAKGAGKTSLTAGFLQAGCALVTEDLLALEPGPAQIRCYPGHPQVRLWPDVAAHYVPHLEGLELVHPAFTKLRVPVGPGGLGSFSPRPRVLAGLYLLERRGAEGDGEIRAVPCTQGEATIELIRYSFVPELVQALGIGPRRLRVLAQVAARVPLWRLDYPRGLEKLAMVRGRVASDLEQRAVPAVE